MKATVLLLLGIMAVFFLAALPARRPPPDEPIPPFPEAVELVGTNELEIGMLLWTPGSNHVYFGRVDAVSEAHRFPDGTTRPAVLVDRDGATWMPREGLEKMLLGVEE